jgi:predicted DCC family thiol-disulfide oxidoreductase YuxK
MISVPTEITEELPPELAASSGARGWVLFDGECSFCRGWVARVEPVLRPRGFVFLPLQTPWVRAFFNLPEEVLLSEMRVVLRTGESFGGADAVIELGKSVWWARPLVALAHLSGAKALLRASYRAIAARRQCLSGGCGLGPLTDQGNPENSNGSVDVLPETKNLGVESIEHYGFRAKARPFGGFTAGLKPRPSGLSSSSSPINSKWRLWAS